MDTVCRALERIGDFSNGALPVVAIPQQTSLIDWQLLDAVDESFLAVRDFFGDGRLHVGEAFLHFKAERVRVAFAFAQEVHRFEPRDAARPGDEVRAGLEAVELLPHDEACLLEHVLRVFHAADEREDVAEQLVLMLAEQLGELLARGRFRHQVFTEKGSRGRAG